MSKDKVIEQPAEHRPVSPLYNVEGHLVRLWSDGVWYCACHNPDCERIKEAVKVYEAEKAKLTAAFKPPLSTINTTTPEVWEQVDKMAKGDG